MQTSQPQHGPLPHVTSPKAIEQQACPASEGGISPAHPRADAWNRHKQHVHRTVAYLLRLAYAAFDKDRFDRCIGLCDEILKVDWGYVAAIDLKSLCFVMTHGKPTLSAVDELMLALKSRTFDDEWPLIPFEESFQIPSPEEWQGIVVNLTPVSREAEGSVDEDGDITAIQRKLATMRIDLQFTNTSLEDILAFVRDFSGLNILLDSEVLEGADPQRPFTFWCKDLVLKDILTLILTPLGLDFVVTEEKVLFLTTPDRISKFAPRN